MNDIAASVRSLTERGLVQESAAPLSLVDHYQRGERDWLERVGAAMIALLATPLLRAYGGPSATGAVPEPFVDVQVTMRFGDLGRGFVRFVLEGDRTDTHPQVSVSVWDLSTDQIVCNARFHVDPGDPPSKAAKEAVDEIMRRFAQYARP